MGYSKLLKKASLVGAFFVSAIWLGTAQALCPMPDGLPSAQVQKVVDGDTLRLKDGRSVRLIGLNTPELGRQNRSAERSARQARLGLWRQPQVQNPAQIRSGGFALVRGEVVSVERNRGGVWLEMRDSLVLQVPEDLFEHFDMSRLQGLAGSTVEARGWVIDRAKRGGLKARQARWMLPLTDRAMLEVLP